MTPGDIMLNAVSANATPTFTYTIVMPPTHGVLSGSGTNVHIHACAGLPRRGQFHQGERRQSRFEYVDSEHHGY